MARQAIGILYFVCLVGGIVATLCMLYYFALMQKGVKGEKKSLTNVLGPLSLFIPQVFDEQGNQARIKMLYFMLLFGVCFAGAMLILNVFPP